MRTFACPVEALPLTRRGISIVLRVDAIEKWEKFRDRLYRVSEIRTLILVFFVLGSENGLFDGGMKVGKREPTAFVFGSCCCALQTP